MMKKVLAMGLMGMGFVVAQGCAVEQGSGEENTVSSEAAVATQCYSMQGIHTTKASLAVAMAMELGRWEPLTDLVNSGSKVTLKSGVTCLKNNCANTKALLGQQDFTPDQNLFQNTSYAGDLVASFSRQQNLITNYTQNNKQFLPPPDHKLTLIAGPTNLGIGACGPHYVFQVNRADGRALTTWEGYTMANQLCYFGFNALGVGCGSNPFLAPQVNTTQTTAAGCPAGQTCIAIDPADGDNGSTTTTTAGSAPTYPLNRVYNPENTLLNTACTTTTGKVTKLVSKCSTTASTCGYLYCM